MPLKGEKSDVYFSYVQQLETSYSIFSVNLDEAFGMRRTGRTAKSFLVLSVSSSLCQRLAHPLLILLHSMLAHAKHFGVAPNLQPLDAQNFQSARGQRVALFNDLVSRVLLTRKLQFTHKISAIADLVEELDSSFESTAQALACGDSLQPDQDWELLDAMHYDLNTCYRESVVLLKSFLHALPDPQLASFQSALSNGSGYACSPALSDTRHLAHRRIAFLKGQ